MALLVTMLAMASPLQAQLAQFTLVDQDLSMPLDAFVPGEVFRYVSVVEVDAAAGQLDGAQFRLPIIVPDITIVPGTASTTHGTIDSGTLASDTVFRVDLGMITNGDPVTLSVDVEIADPFASCDRPFFARAFVVANGIGERGSMDPDSSGFSTATLVDPSVFTGHNFRIQEANPNLLAEPGERLSATVELSLGGNALVEFFRWDLLGLSAAALVAGTVTVDHPAAVIASGNGAGDTDVSVEISQRLSAASMTVRFDVVVDDPPPVGAAEVILTGIWTRPCLSAEQRSVTLPLVAVAPDLVLTKSDGGITAEAGDTITYSLGVTNRGSQVATGVVLTEIVPQNTRFNAAESDAAWTCAGVVPGSVCTWDAGSLAPGVGVSGALFAVDVDAPLAAGVAQISNTAMATDDGASGPDANPLDNTATELTPLGVGTSPDLALTKSDGGVTVDAGETIVYTLGLSNLGNQDASGVRPDRDGAAAYDIRCRGERSRLVLRWSLGRIDLHARLSSGTGGRTCSDSGVCGPSRLPPWPRW